eukprot:SM000002S05657  [mRNA]  locus=s2:1440309:1445495:+ [translate_table: standard]
MWAFYALALPVTLAMVVLTLHHFASPRVSPHVRLIVAFTWFINLSIVVLVPVDVWKTMSGLKSGAISVMWGLSYWSAFFLTWLIIPLLQGYEDAGDFTHKERLKTSIRSNLILYASVGLVAITGVTLLIVTHEIDWSGLVSLAIQGSNTFGLVTGAFLLGFGLVDLPRGLWTHADLAARQMWLSHKVAKVAQKLDNAHQELSTVLVIAQATSTQMSRRDLLRPMMDIIDEMAAEDTTFKPSGGRMGESDMDYDADEKSMADLRRRLRRAQDMYYRYKTEYATVVWKALEVEETIKNFEHGKGTWKFVSPFRDERKGRLGTFLDVAEWWWRCIFKQQIVRACAIVLGFMSFAVIFAEATILAGSTHVIDLSLFSILIKAAGGQEELVQLLTFLPLVYICVCTYYSIFKLGMFTFYYLVPGHTDSVSLLLNCSMVSRFAAPMCYNFLNLIHLSRETTFEKRMGPTNGLPFLGGQFNTIFPLIMVVYTILVASNVFNYIVDKISGWFSSWHKLRFELEDEGVQDGFNATGLLILQRERSSLERGAEIGEHVVPLARHFGSDFDLENPTAASPKASKTQASKGEKEALNGSASHKGMFGREVVTSIYSSLTEQEKPTSNRNAIAAKYRDASRKAPLSHKQDAPNSASKRAFDAADDPFRDNLGRPRGPALDPRRAVTPPRLDPFQSSTTEAEFMNGHSGASAGLPAAAPTGGGMPRSTASPPTASEGGLESRWDAMKSRFKDFTSRVASGKGFRAPGLAADDVDPQTGERASASAAATLDSIFEGLGRTKRADAEEAADQGEHSHSLLGYQPRSIDAHRR